LSQLTTTTSDWLSVAALLGDAAFELDPKLRFSAFGPNTVFGHQTRDLLGKPAGALLDAPDDALAGILATVRDELVIWHGQISVTDNHHVQHVCRLALAPKLNRDGKALGLYGLLIDLTAPELNETLATGESNWNRALDPETGLWSATSFIEQVARRFDRLDVECQSGTLLFLGFGRAKASQQTPTAMRLADELREIIRPTDLLGRVNRTTIGLWCDNMDHLTGAERAAKFCQHMPASLPDQAVIAVGLATRWPNSGDDSGTILDRAGIALKDAYAATARDGNGSWRVWQAVAPL